ncbi:HAD family hydrolase [Cryptosporangium sp. NPDC051539]|uniref:HAD family hydrolase n=1 Tax=Cryptosporangium sp. NPDC051539 TaxID=3363962 RepID=UPI0037B5FAEA
MKPVRAVLFDLDGTLVQTRIASWEIFRRINTRFDLGVDEPEQYFDLFRGNIFASLDELCRDEAQAAEAKAAFLELLRSDYTPSLVPGITDVVRRLAGHCTLAVMSSNAMQVLRRVLLANDLAFCFAHVFGGDVAPDKKAAMRVFLADAGSGFGRRCAADYDEAGAARLPDPSSTVLVTDTAGDVRDALEVGIRVVGVAWGMHSVEQLTAAGAEFVALWPQELAAHLLGDAASLPPEGACAIPAPAAVTPAAATPTSVAPASVAPASAIPAADCGCGCDGACTPPSEDDPRRAATLRRDRRKSATAALRALLDAPAASPGTASDELLAAVRRVVRR